MRHILALVFGLLLSTGGGPAIVSAQDETPPGGDAVGPAECRVAPRSINEIRRMIAALPTQVPFEGIPPPGDVVEVSGPREALDVTIGGTPMVVDGTVVATAPSRHPSQPPAPPPGESADPQTAAEITAAVREFIACENGEDPLRYYALFSDAALRQLLANVVPVGDEEAFLASLTATPRPGGREDVEPTPIVEEVRMLSDGRVGARVSTDRSEADDLFVFAKVGDRWLLDDVYVVGPGEAPGTPSP